MAKAGVTTNELNDFAQRLHAEAGVIAAPLHYGTPPFPKSICTSLNEVICHGIPNDTPLEYMGAAGNVTCSFAGWSQPRQGCGPLVTDWNGPSSLQKA